MGLMWSTIATYNKAISQSLTATASIQKIGTLVAGSLVIGTAVTGTLIRGEVENEAQQFLKPYIVLYPDYKGQTDMAAVGFKKGMEGFEHAETFERSFQASGHGREEWGHGRRDGEMYAWLLTKEHVDTGLQSRDWPASLNDLFKKQMHKVTKTIDEVSSSIHIMVSGQSY